MQKILVAVALAVLLVLSVAPAPTAEISMGTLYFPSNGTAPITGDLSWKVGSYEGVSLNADILFLSIDRNLSESAGGVSAKIGDPDKKLKFGVAYAHDYIRESCNTRNVGYSVLYALIQTGEIPLALASAERCLPTESFSIGMVEAGVVGVQYIRRW